MPSRRVSAANSRHNLSMPGLRELKKQKTRWAIQEHALRLIAQQGYDATTVEQIAAAAEISPSTFFRYFPTKEDVVIADDYDPMIMDVLAVHVAGEGPVTAFRRAMREVFAQIGDDERRRVFERTRLIMSVPSLRARTFENFTTTTALVAQTLGRRLGTHPDDLRIRVLAAVCIGALSASIYAWIDADGTRDLADIVDESLALLEGGQLNEP
jgi:AcrR family transcriptional regulator